MQGNSADPQTPQTSVSVPYIAAQTAGNLNVVVVGWNDSIAQVQSVTDTSGNSYVLAVGPTVQTGFATQAIYYAKNIAVATANANSVTVQFTTAANYPDIRIAEYSGLDKVNPVDVSAAAQGNSSTSASGPVTTTSANDLLFGANLVQSFTLGAGTGFTSRVITNPDGDIIEDQLVAATGNYEATVNLQTPLQWIMQMLAFRLAAVGGNPAPAITSLSPNAGAVGTPVTIAGTGFGSSQGASTISFKGVIAPPASWSDTLIIVPVPAGATSGNVVVTESGVSSNAVPFTVVAPPTITSSVSPARNAQGWNNSNVDISYTCAAGGEPLTSTSCPSPQTVTTEGQNQTITGTVVDSLGGIGTVSTILNIDKTSPALVITSSTDGSTVTTSSVVVTGTASDALSGLASVSCNGASVPVTGGSFSCNISLVPGVNLVMVTATDVAGNMAGVRMHVTDSAALPTPTALQITPANANVLVGATQQFTAVDQLGRPRTDALWTVDNTSIATITTDSAPILTGVAAGTVTLTATVGSLSAQVQVHILGGTSLPVGTVLWSAPPVPGFTTQRIVQAVPTSNNAPDLYAIDTDTNSNVLVRAFTSDGQQLWQTAIAVSAFSGLDAVSGQAMGDSSGGLIMFGSSGASGVLDIDGQTGSIAWQSSSAEWGYNNTAAIGPDGSMFVRGLDGTMLKLDPNTGQSHTMYMGPRTLVPSVIALCIANIPSLVIVGVTDQPANLSSPIVDAQGNVLFTAQNTAVSLVPICVNSGVDGAVNEIDTPINLLVSVAPDGTPTAANLPAAAVQSTVLAPDGRGGALVAYQDTNQPMMFDSTSGSSYPDPLGGTTSLVLSETGFAGGNAFSSVACFDPLSGAVQYTYQSAGGGLSMIAATADGGLALNDANLGAIQLDAAGAATQVTPGAVLTQPEYSWTSAWYVASISGSSLSQIALPILVDEASTWASVSGDPSANGSAEALCDCLTETTIPDPPPPSATCQICNLAGNTVPSNQPPSCTSTPGALSTYLILVGDPSTDPQGGHNAGGLFNLAAQTQANSLHAQGDAVVACRVSTIQQFNQALTSNGMITGGVIFFGHAGALPRTDLPGPVVYYSLVSVGEGTDDSANISYLNVGTLSNAQLGPDVTITLNACRAGLSWSPGQPPIALLMANRLQRDVRAHRVGMYFSQDPNDRHRGGIGKAPSNLPIYMLPEGGVPKPRPTLFIGH